MKNCFKCKENKPLSDFYKHKAMTDGHLNKCKDCTKRDTRRHRALRFDYYSKYDQKRYQEDGERRKKQNIHGRKWREKHPKAYKAQTAVSNAVRDGRLLKEPCLFCGAEKNIHAHHNDYSKPLDVVWLCAKCHHRMHAKFPGVHGHA